MTTRPRKRVPAHKYAFLWRLMADTALSASAKCRSSDVAAQIPQHKNRPVQSKLCRHRQGHRSQPPCDFPCVAELKDGGWITVESTKGGSPSHTNRYSFDFERVSSAAPPPVTACFTSEAECTKGCQVQLHTNHLEPPALRAVGWGEEISPRRAPDGAAEEFEELRQLWQRPYGMNEAKALAAFNRVTATATFRRRTSSTAHGAGWRRESHLPAALEAGWTMAHGETIRPLRRNQQPPQTKRRRSGRRTGGGIAGKGADGEDYPKAAHGDGEANDGGGKACSAMANAAEGQGSRGGAGQALPPLRGDGEIVGEA